MRMLKKMLLIGMLVLPAIVMLSCSSSESFILPDIVRIWQETKTINEQTTNSSVFSFDADNNLVSIKLGSNLDLTNLTSQLNLENKTSTQLTNTVYWGNEVTLAQVTGTFEGQGVVVELKA